MAAVVADEKPGLPFSSASFARGPPAQDTWGGPAAAREPERRREREPF